jgi:hypothetical protein
VSSVSNNLSTSARHLVFIYIELINNYSNNLTRSINLDNKFNLNTTTRLNKNKYIIIIKHDSYNRFANLTDKYIIPSMRYKLPN